MRSTAHLNLTVWDSNNDTFDHTALASNWDKIDADYTRTRPTNQAEVLTSVPVASNFEGRLVYLSAADSGFSAGSLIRYHGSSFSAVNSVEVLTSVPTLSNFAGRMVLLSVASGTFAQWALIRYDGTSWALVNNSYEILGAVPVTNNFAGRLVMLSSASGGYNAWDLIRYNGSTWARVGPDPIYPGTELAYYAQTTTITSTITSQPGDTIVTFSPATFENVKYYLEVLIPAYSINVTASTFNVYLRESGTGITSPLQPAVPVSGAQYNFAGKAPFVPAAGSHTYAVTWNQNQAGTGSIYTTSIAPAIFRIIKA